VYDSDRFHCQVFSCAIKRLLSEINIVKSKGCAQAHPFFYGKERAIMGVPLSYQISEYDCGPTSVMNAISFTFDRKKIKPDLITGIYRYCLDGFNCHGATGVTGTSGNCMRFLAGWFNQYGKQRHFPIHCEFLSAQEVHLQQGSRLLECIRNGGSAVVQCWLCVRHYVLITGIDEEKELVYLFDPYYPDKAIRRKDITLVDDHPASYNRIVPFSRVDNPGHDYYSFGESDRECLLFENTEKRNG